MPHTGGSSVPLLGQGSRPNEETSLERAPKQETKKKTAEKAGKRASWKHMCGGASTWCITIGMLQNGTSGFGSDSVSGRSRVPNPPTRMSAFIFVVCVCGVCLARVPTFARTGTSSPCQFCLPFDPFTCDLYLPFDPFRVIRLQSTLTFLASFNPS